MRRAAPLLVSLVLLCAACGGSSDGGSAAADDVTTTSEAPPTDAEQRAKLLTAADLADGWAAKPAAVEGIGEGNSANQGPACLKDDPADPVLVHVATTLTQPNGFPTLEEELDVYAPDVAASAIGAKSDRVDACPQIAFSEMGIDFTGTITPVTSLAKRGDESRAWLMHFGGQGLAFDFAIVHVRIGSERLTFTYGVMDGSDPYGPAPALVDLALAKI